MGVGNYRRRKLWASVLRWASGVLWAAWLKEGAVKHVIWDFLLGFVEVEEVKTALEVQGVRKEVVRP